MKKTIFFILISSLFFSCDPVAQMEASIENRTSETLYISFASEISDTLVIESGQKVLFQDAFDVGNTYLEPNLDEYDSVTVSNKSEIILKVYRPSDKGKNIYNVSSWDSREPSKRVFFYTYKITNEDFD